jgi:hypothetical protein
MAPLSRGPAAAAQDLAKLSDAEYFTWAEPEALLHAEQPITLHTAKHMNYAPDPAAFTRIVSRAIAHTRGGRRPHTEL